MPATTKFNMIRMDPIAKEITLKSLQSGSNARKLARRLKRSIRNNESEIVFGRTSLDDGREKFKIVIRDNARGTRLHVNTSWAVLRQSINDNSAVAI